MITPKMMEENWGKDWETWPGAMFKKPFDDQSGVFSHFEKSKTYQRWKRTAKYLKRYRRRGQK